jgi:hypothetical protein
VPENLLSIPLAFLIIVSCHEAGRYVLSFFHLNTPNFTPIEITLLKLAAGFIALELTVALMGVAGLIYPLAMWLLLLLLLASAVIKGRSDLSGSWKSINEFFIENTRTPLNRLFFTILCVALAMDFVLTMVPTTAWDALTYHYTLPKIWLENHRMIPVPGNAYHQLPMASEMLFMLSFALGGLRPDGTGVGHLAANHITWVTGFISVIALMALSRKLVSGEAKGNSIWDINTPGIIGAIALMSLPIMYFEEMEGGYIENFFNFFTLMMLLALLIFKDTKNAKMILLIGLIAGGLLAVKHTGLIVDAIVLVILIVWILRSEKKSCAFGNLGFGILIAVLIPVVWYIKSYMATGDPMYPFVTKALNPDAMVPDIMYWSNPNVSRSVLDFILYIPRLTYDVSIVQFDFRLLSWYFAPLIPFVIWWSYLKSAGRVIGLITWLMILFIFIQAPGEPRYFLVAWGMYACLGVWGLFQVTKNAGGLQKFLIPLILLVPITLSMIDRTREINHRVPTILGLATVDDYFGKSLDIWPLINYINTETEEDAKIVMVEPRVFYMQRDCTIWYPFPTTITSKWDSGNKKFTGSNFDYLILTWGPNYRALSLHQTLNLYNSNETTYNQNIKMFGGVVEFPVWIFELADYTEPAITFNDHQGYSVDSEMYWSPSQRFDVRSIGVIDVLLRYEVLDVEYYNHKTGVIFNVNKEALENLPDIFDEM